MSQIKVILNIRLYADSWYQILHDLEDKLYGMDIEDTEVGQGIISVEEEAHE